MKIRFSLKSLFISTFLCALLLVFFQFLLQKGTPELHIDCADESLLVYYEDKLVGRTPFILRSKDLGNAGLKCPKHGVALSVNGNQHRFLEIIDPDSSKVLGRLYFVSKEVLVDNNQQFNTAWGARNYVYWTLNNERPNPWPVLEVYSIID